MKKIVMLLLTLSCICILMNSCSKESVYQQKTEEYLISSLKSPSSYKFISFEPTKEETLREQIQERLSYFSSDTHLSFYYDQVETYRKYWEEAKADKWPENWVSDYEEKYNDAQKELKKELDIVDFLKKQLDIEDELLNKIVAKEFKLTYEAMNPMGVMIRSFVNSRFNENDELVAIQQEDEEWTLIGKIFSIPGYYDNIK